MPGKWKDELTEKLCKAFLTLKSEEEVCDFLEDVATIGEIRDLSQRLEVARLLNGANTHLKITEVTGASSATISRVKKCLDYGAGGYKTVLKRMYPDEFEDEAEAEPEAKVESKGKGKKK